jgi:hypothetical protein
MPELVPWLLTIHILTAIVAFGPTFALPVIAGLAAREPQHGLFALRVSDRISRRMTLPLALTMPISGGLLVWAEGIDLATAHWLVAAIGLYAIAIVFAFAVQLRTLARMIEIAAGLAARQGQASSATPGTSSASSSLPAPLPAGPGAASATPETLAAGGEVPPAVELARLGARVRNGGILLMLLVVTIVSLMAGKPAI